MTDNEKKETIKGKLRNWLGKPRVWLDKVRELFNKVKENIWVKLVILLVSLLTIIWFFWKFYSNRVEDVYTSEDIISNLNDWIVRLIDELLYILTTIYRLIASLSKLEVVFLFLIIVIFRTYIIKLTEQILVRLGLLALTVVISIGLLWKFYSNSFMEVFLLEDITSTENYRIFGLESSHTLTTIYNLIAPLNTGGVLILSLLTATLLWIFRTYDVRKALRNSEESYKQSNFFDAMNRLVSDNPLDIDIGVARLIKLSEIDESVKADIRIAFEKRLKYLPKDHHDNVQVIKDKVTELKNAWQDNEQNNFKDANNKLVLKSLDLEEKPKLTYAQHILEWLQKNNTGKIDLDNACFDFQEFVLDDDRQEKEKKNTLKHFFINKNNSEPKHKGISFRFSNLQSADLEGTDFRKTNLLRAN